jgi:hypothetical protein
MPRTAAARRSTGVAAGNRREHTMAVTTSQPTEITGTCHDCGADAPDGPVWAIGPDLTSVRLCWDCSDDRIYIQPYTDSRYDH